MGHSHHSDDERVPRAVRRAVLYVLLPFALVTLVGLIALWPSGKAGPLSEQLGFGQLVRGTVTSMVEKDCGNAELDEEAIDNSEHGVGDSSACANATLQITSGQTKGDEVVLDISIGPTALAVKQGSKVVLNYEPDAPEESQYQIVDNQRGRPLLLLTALFAVCVVLLGRKRGLAALVGLGITFVVLVRFMLPALLEGQSPVQVALVAAAVIMFVSLYITHGFTIRTSVAVIGTLSSLLLTGLLAAAFTAWSSFSGLATEEATFLSATQGQVDLRGLFLAGVVIGSLGVLDDVTVTQTAAVWELRRANAQYSVLEIYRAGVRIGRDHIASTVNTLVLAYAGASLPLLVLFTVSGRGVTDTLTSEVVAQEVVRALVGGIGLVASVPITTIVAAFVAVRGDPTASNDRPRSLLRGDEDEVAETVEWWSRLRSSE